MSCHSNATTIPITTPISPIEVFKSAAMPQIPLSQSRKLLTDLACEIGNRLAADACSIYRLDLQRRTLILTATVGLRQDCVDSLQMPITEGLCGLVAQQSQAVRISSDASTHPRFKYFPEAGEEPYKTFLGVPVIDVNRIVGVLVVQTIEPRNFTADDEKLLKLTGRQIGPLLDRLTHESAA